MSALSSRKQQSVLEMPAQRRLGAAFTTFAERAGEIVRNPAFDDYERCSRISALLEPLLASAAWIPPELVVPALSDYRRECLFEAVDGCFSIGVFTWEAGHLSRIHDHHAWAIIGNMTGVLRSENFLAIRSGEAFKYAVDDIIYPGQTMWSTRATGDIHRVSVASKEKSTSIHLYGCRFDAVNRTYYSEILPTS